MINEARERARSEVIAALFRELRVKRGLTRRQLAIRIRPRFQYHHPRSVKQLVGMIGRIERAQGRPTLAPIGFMIFGMEQDPGALLDEIEGRWRSKRRGRRRARGLQSA
jgi:hypothetical protein